MLPPTPQTSFPGNLHLVLVLRPSALLSSAPSPSSSTDLGFRFSQDDFLLKMPVNGIVAIWGLAVFHVTRAACSQVLMLGDLLRYLDNNRPTSDECGGGAPSDWIVLRSVNKLTSGLCYWTCICVFAHGRYFCVCVCVCVMCDGCGLRVCARTHAGHRDLCGDGEGGGSPPASLRLRVVGRRSSGRSRRRRLPATLAHAALPTHEGARAGASRGLEQPFFLLLSLSLLLLL